MLQNEFINFNLFPGNIAYMSDNFRCDLIQRGAVGVTLTALVKHHKKPRTLQDVVWALGILTSGSHVPQLLITILRDFASLDSNKQILRSVMARHPIIPDNVRVMIGI